MGRAILAEPGPLAQLVEQGTLNPKVAGSNPARPIATPAATPTPHHHRGHRARRRHRGTNGAPPGAPPSGRDPASPEDWQGLVRPVDAGFPCATASPTPTPAPPGRGLGRAYKAALGNATKSCAFPCGLANAGGSGGQGAGRRRLTAEAGRRTRQPNRRDDPGDGPRLRRGPRRGQRRRTPPRRRRRRRRPSTPNCSIVDADRTPSPSTVLAHTSVKVRRDRVPGSVRARRIASKRSGNDERGDGGWRRRGSHRECR